MRDLGMAFEALVRSTDDLHERFGTRQTVYEALACFEEEIHEFKAEAVTGNLLYAYPLTEEAVDVIVTLLGVLRAADIDRGMLAAMLLTVAMKNDDKSHLTHEVRADGKIARKG